MIKFLFKGLIRDRHRSLFPVLTVTLGVMLTVLMHCWVTGILGDMIDYNARFLTGHVKIMSRAYAENVDQIPNDLALLGVDSLIQKLRKEFPRMNWEKRVRFGGLLDAPDQNGETRAQGPCIGFAIDLLSGDPSEIQRFNIKKALVKGSVPEKSGEMLISDEFAEKLGVQPGDVVTLITSSMYGDMAMQNFTISGTVRFGVKLMDRGAMIADISDIQTVLDMQDASGEILGYFPSGMYDDLKAQEIAKQFNAEYAGSKDEFAPIMMTLGQQNDLASMLTYMKCIIGIIIAVFVLAMSIVLWNAGLLGSLRRFGEIGVRLAIGERNSHIYRSLILESVLIGVFGSIFGTAVGLGFSWLLQIYGIDVGNMMQNATMMFPTVYRAHITRDAFFIGFVPGILSTVLGTSLSGIGIYRRKTAQLFKELEV
jgi:putative ABC transport system permease protein